MTVFKEANVVITNGGVGVGRALALEASLRRSRSASHTTPSGRSEHNLACIRSRPDTPPSTAVSRW
ncbi:hypothetical protein [Ottowia thiooxydans]|uniref:Uncharacterized protein n=1 Tax=Ottowia thiooxydans TaxID=219182 RepID=A0ABV2Q3N2_9BURK